MRKLRDMSDYKVKAFGYWCGKCRSYQLASGKLWGRGRRLVCKHYVPRTQLAVAITDKGTVVYPIETAVGPAYPVNSRMSRFS